MIDFDDDVIRTIQDPSHSNTVDVLERCPLCQRIADAVLRWRPIGKHHTLSLGTWKDFVDRIECETCQQIVHHFESDSRGGYQTPMYGSCPVIFESIGERYYILCEVGAQNNDTFYCC